MESSPAKEIRARWLIAGGAFVLLGFCFSPPFGAFRLWSRVPEMVGMLEVRRGASVLAQMADPGAAIADPLHGAIRWRLLFPLLGHVAHLPGAALFALAPLGCLLTLAFMVTVLRRSGFSHREAGLGAVVLGATSWFFTSVSWLGYYDSWLVLGLLLVAFARSPWAVWLACVWAPWVDERFVLGALLALLCRHVVAIFTGAGAPAARTWRRDYAIAAALLAAFVAVRLGWLGGPPGSTTTVKGYLATLDGQQVPWTRFLFGAWSGLRIAWVLVGAAVALAWPRPGPALLLAAAIIIVVAVGLGTAQDLSRSMMMVLPVALLGLLLARGRWTDGVRTFLPGAALAALVLPGHHVMTDRVNPVFYLYHELAALQNPPPAAMPELRILRGILEEQQGDTAGAEADFTLATRLGDQPSVALQQRGILFASERRWAEARRDFSALVELQPGEPDGWFLRAQIDLALGDSAGARADLQQALAVGSPRWLGRPDVARFQARLNPRAAP